MSHQTYSRTTYLSLCFKLVGLLLLTLVNIQAASAKPLSTTGLDWKLQEVEGERRLEQQDYEGAERSFRAALKAARRTRTCTLDELAGCMQSLAAVLQLESQTQDVVPLYNKSIKVLEKAHGKDSPKIIPTLLVLGGIFELETDYKLAIKSYNRALEIIEKDSGANSLAFADCQHRLGRATFESGLHPEAEMLYRASLAGVMQQPQLPSSDLLNALLADYIDVFTKSSEPGKALNSDFQKQLLRDQLGKLARTKGIGGSAGNRQVTGAVTNPGRIDASSTYATSMDPNSTNSNGANSGSTNNTATQTSSEASARQNSLAAQLTDPLALEQIDRQRIDFYERTIAIDEKSLGPEHPSVARDLSGLASIYLIEKKYEQAKPLLSRALSVYKAAYGPDALLVRRTQQLLDMVQEEQNPPESEKIAVNEYVKYLPTVPLAAQKIEIVLKLNYLAFLNYCHGKIADADQIYAWALADTFLSTGEQSILVEACLNDYSRVLRSAGKQEEAATMESNAHTILRRTLTRQAALSMP